MREIDFGWWQGEYLGWNPELWFGVGKFGMPTSYLLGCVEKAVQGDEQRV